MSDQNQQQARETNDDGTYKGSNTSEGGNNPSGYPTPDAPVEFAKGDLVDEPDTPQAARPDSPMNVDDRQ